MGVIVAGSAGAFIRYGWHVLCGLGSGMTGLTRTLSMPPTALAHSHEHSLKILKASA
jgi:hypothetical protein